MGEALSARHICGDTIRIRQSIVEQRGVFWRTNCFRKGVLPSGTSQTKKLQIRQSLPMFFKHSGIRKGFKKLVLPCEDLGGRRPIQGFLA